LPKSIVFESLLKGVEIPNDGTLSRTLQRDDHVEVELLAFAGGQEIPEHTAEVPAVLQILQGDARVTLDGEVRELSAGAWIYMEARLPHAVYAKSPLVILLTMLTGEAQK
jgi:quercetin dioxygenase-like cupin family protein